MGKSLKQFRYYGEDHSRNQPRSLTSDQLKSGSIFLGADSNLSSIASLGIQAIPGTKFYLNDSADSIIIGSAGIYELSLNDNYEITALKFDDKSLNLINQLSNSAYLIIDIVYNTEE